MGLPLCGRLILSITSVITDRIGLQSVLLLSLIYNTNNYINEVMNQQFFELSWKN